MQLHKMFFFFTLNHQSHAFWIIKVRNKNSLQFFFFYHNLFCREMSHSLVPFPTVFLAFPPLSHMAFLEKLWTFLSFHRQFSDADHSSSLCLTVDKLALSLSLENFWLSWTFIFLCQCESQHSFPDLAKLPLGLCFQESIHNSTRIFVYLVFNLLLLIWKWLQL